MKYLFAFLLIGSAAFALPKDEVAITCKELALSVIPNQRDGATARCIEFAGDECDRLERQLHENCIESSHSDNAIAFDMGRGDKGSCDAGLIKRNGQRELCENLQRDCRDLKAAMGNSGLTVSCKSFRDEDNKRLCGEIDTHVKRVTELYDGEKKKCAVAKPKGKG